MNKKPLTSVWPAEWDGSLIKVFVLFGTICKLRLQLVLQSHPREAEQLKSWIQEMRCLLSQGILDATESLEKQLWPLITAFSADSYNISYVPSSVLISACSYVV